MNILFKGVVFAIGAISIQAITLKQLITHTLQYNQNIKADSYTKMAKQKSYESQKNIFNPNITIGASYNQLSMDLRDTQIGKTQSAFVKLGLNLYDGGKSIALKKQKLYEYTAQKYQNITNIKETILNLITMYFNLKTINEDIKVYKEKAKALKAQYERVKTKYNEHMTTIDEVLKLKSEYESNSYTIAQLKYQKEELQKNIELLSGIKITTFDTKTLPSINLKYKPTSDIKALEETLKAQQENINITKSSKKPQIKLENTTTWYKYDDYNHMLLKDLPNKQNQFILSLSYNLFDTSSKSKIESSKLSKLAIADKLAYLKHKSYTEFQLAKKKLQIQKLKLKSLKSAVDMANSVYDIIKQKYENGVVDNITYLDALSKKIYNLALYKQALNDLEIAKANYYFKSGVDYRQMLKDWQ